MQRVTLRVPEQQVDVVDRLVEQGVFPNRSEAVRAALRDMLAQQPEVEDAVAELEPGPKNYSRLSTGGDD